MPEQPRPDEVPTPHVSCDMCKKEIPHEHAESREAEDMVLYFCGLSCYQEWQAGHPNGKTETGG